jgi:hypothetical protein
MPGSGASNCNNGSRCSCGKGPGAGVAAGPPTPQISDALITSFRSPRSRRRRRRRRYPAAALATTGAGAAASTGPDQAPPTTGAGCLCIWGRGNKNTVAYPVPEQDMQKRVQSSRRVSRRARIGHIIGEGLAARPAWRPGPDRRKGGGDDGGGGAPDPARPPGVDAPGPGSRRRRQPGGPARAVGRAVATAAMETLISDCSR